MHGDGVVHSMACHRHLVTAECPVECLAPSVGSRVVGRLARADDRHGAPVGSCGATATVGDVVRLYRQDRLGGIGGLGALSIREIGLALLSCGLAAAADSDAITMDCPVECLRGVVPARVLNRPARADGRGVPVAPGGPPVTVGNVVRHYRASRLSEIAGLGARGISEIEAGLVLAGLILGECVPIRQLPRPPAPMPDFTVGTDGGRSAVPDDRLPGTGSG